MTRPLAIIFGGVLIAGGVLWLTLRPRGDAESLEVTAKELPALALPKLAADDWPCWRGPRGDNSVGEQKIPTTWTETENVVWKTAIPGRGHSTPIFFGNRVFLTSADENNPRQFAMALDRAKGTKLWETTVHQGGFVPKHPDNSQASGTPACDGERLFVVFPNNRAIHVTALDPGGMIVWKREVGPHGGNGAHGSGTSLAIGGSYLFVSDDSPGRAWIAAIHRGTGEIAWRKDRASKIGSYGSPLAITMNGKLRVLLPGSGKVTCYDGTTGNVVWERDGLSDAIGNTVGLTDTLIFASSGFPQRKLLALNYDGSVAWRKDNGNDIPYPPTIACVDSKAFIVSDQGFVTCVESATGKQLWKERLGGSFYSSPLIVGKNIYASSREGVTTVFEASGDGFKEVAKNKLPGGINASPVAVGNRLYVRTATHLYCFGK